MRTASAESRRETASSHSLRFANHVALREHTHSNSSFIHIAFKDQSNIINWTTRQYNKTTTTLRLQLPATILKCSESTNYLKLKP